MVTASLWPLLHNASMDPGLTSSLGNSVLMTLGGTLTFDLISSLLVIHRGIVFTPSVNYHQMVNSGFTLTLIHLGLQPMGIVFQPWLGSSIHS